MKKQVIISVAVSVICAVCCTAQDYDVSVSKLYQNDYQERIDNSNETIANSGCTLTAWAMLINQALKAQALHEKNPDGTKGPLILYTPAELNDLLNAYRYEQKIYKKDEDGTYVKDENNRYIVERVENKNGWAVTIGDDGKPVGSSTDINMGALLKAVENNTKSRSFEEKALRLERYKATGFNEEDIPSEGVTLDDTYKKVLEELKDGRPVVVRTRNTRDREHTVLVKSFRQTEDQPEGKGRYDIADPWRKRNGTSIEWLDDEEYMNKIWGWNTGVFQKGGGYDLYEVPSDYWIDPDYLYDPDMNPEQYGLQVRLPSFPFIEPGNIALCDFAVSNHGHTVKVTWTTASEIENAGFNVHRSEVEDGEYVRINEQLIPAEGSEGAGASYRYDDTDVQVGKTYYYKLESLDLTGTSTWHGPISVTLSATDVAEGPCAPLPDAFGLAQNYPNPFNPSTTMRYALPVISEGKLVTGAVHTTLTIYNVLGQQVRTLVDEAQEPGYYTVSWDTRDDAGYELSSGIYFYRLAAGGTSQQGGGSFVSTRKMVLMR